NDLHYRGYDILELADQASFEEVAYLLIYGNLPTKSQLTTYQAQLISQRGLPIAIQKVLKQLPTTAHAMDVLRTYVSVFGSIHPEKESHPSAGARDIANRFMASMASALLYWYHFSQHGRKIDVETTDGTLGAHF